MSWELQSSRYFSQRWNERKFVFFFLILIFVFFFCFQFFFTVFRLSDRNENRSMETDMVFIVSSDTHNTRIVGIHVSRLIYYTVQEVSVTLGRPKIRNCFFFVVQTDNRRGLYCSGAGVSPVSPVSGCQMDRRYRG